MFESGDVGVSIGSFFITDGHFYNFKVKFIGSENQVEIAKGIEFAKEFAVWNELNVIGSEHDFRAA